MSFNDLAKQEAAAKKASQEKEQSPSSTNDKSPATETKPVNPPQD